MSITWVPLQGKELMDCTVPSPPASMRLIQRRPNSPAKKSPSYSCGNFTSEVEAAS
ncbi:hypothetical protein SGLAM104S_10554 [Streptomyces glaucescens]